MLWHLPLLCEFLTPAGNACQVVNIDDATQKMQLDDFVYNLVMSIPKYRKRLLIVSIGTLMSLYMRNKRAMDGCISGIVGRDHASSKESGRRASKSHRVGVNALFFSQLRKIIPVCIPGKIAPNSPITII